MTQTKWNKKYIVFRVLANVKIIVSTEEKKLTRSNNGANLLPDSRGFSENSFLYSFTLQ